MISDRRGRERGELSLPQFLLEESVQQVIRKGKKEKNEKKEKENVITQFTTPVIVYRNKFRNKSKSLIYNFEIFM